MRRLVRNRFIRKVDRYYGAELVTIDKTLRRRGLLVRARNVLKRDERIERLEFEDRFNEGDSPFGLPKVRVLKATSGKRKKKKAKADEEEGTTESK